MKSLYLAIGLMMSFSCIADSVIPQKSSVADLAVLKTVQSWGLVQPGTSCIEHYQFSGDGTLHIQSDQQRVAGTYALYISQRMFELPAMMMHYTTDNLKPDCAGNTQNQVGSSTTIFIKKESDQKLYLCEDNLGKNCPVYLKPDQ